jgi:hypothetical protein
MGKTKVLNLSGTHAGLVLLLVFLLPGQVLGQAAGPTTHTIFMTAVEVKGGTTADKLAPPPSIRRISPKVMISRHPGRQTRAIHKGGRYPVTGSILAL